jgi:serine/threonine-protein kinase
MGLMTKLRIDPSTWKTLNRLLDEALELPPETLPRWLDNLAPELDALAPRLRELLAHRGALETADFLLTLPRVEIQPGAFVDESAHAERPGREIGPYRLVRELGSGGMGVVWLAERTDGLIKRPVALKLPHGAWKRAGLAERMAREREILATLTHPNIAHLYDAGVTAGGQPYLAIEFVEGMRLDVYCREQRLDVEARLRLFAQVVRAVAYAHGKLVVHRDLKPANILVSAEGRARLLDFGIAKLLDEGQARETAFTALSGRALTPDYASPEQILGEPLTIASDVYSLGVVLYELLSEQRPYKLERDSRGALENAILQVDPPRPSEVGATPWRRSLRGDLDTIVLTAMKKNPAERYATAHALLDDLERFLSAHPVLAQPDSRWYRARKFVARNKLAVGAAAAIVMTVLVGAGIALWQARVAIAERDRAEEVKNFIGTVFRDADPFQRHGGQLTGAALLRGAVADINGKFRARPALRVELLTLVGSSLVGLGDVDGAEKVLQQAAADATRFLGPAALETVRARVSLAGVYHARRDFTRLQTDVEELLPRARVLMQDDGEPLVQLMLYRRDASEAAGRRGDAEAQVQETLSTARRLLGDRHPLTVRASNAQGLTYLPLPHRQKELLAETDRGLAFAYAAYGEDSVHPLVLEMLSVRAMSLGGVGQLGEAIVVLKKSLAGLRQATGPDSLEVVNCLQTLAGFTFGTGALQESIAYSQEAIAILEKKVSRDSSDYAVALVTLGSAMLAARQAAGAYDLAERAERIFAKERGPADKYTLRARFNRAVAAAYQGRYADATRLFDIVDGADSTMADTMDALHMRGVVQRLAGDPSAAAATQKKALGRIALDDPLAAYYRSLILPELGLAEVELGNAAAAETALEEFIATSDRQSRSMTPTYAESLVGLGRAEMLRNAPSRAIEYFTRSDTFWREFDADNRSAGEAALWLGRCQLALGREQEAVDALRRAEGLLATSPRRTRGSGHPPATQ